MGDATAWVALVAALGGALVGGLASAVGGWWLSRTEHIREQRVAVLADLLPEMRTALDAVRGGAYIAPNTRSLAQRLAYRALASRPDADYGVRIHSALQRYEQGTHMYMTDEGQQEMGEGYLALERVLADYETHLRQKLSGQA
jgi:hypothetical protein